MAVIISGVGQLRSDHSNHITVSDEEDQQLRDGAIVSVDIDGSRVDLSLSGINRLMNALEMVVKNNS
jgi:hypothetical protein